MADSVQRTGAEAFEVSEFSRKVSELLERTEYRRCDKGEDLEDIYRLRYKSYRMSDMVPENDAHVIEDDLDDTPNCYKFGIYVDGVLASTLRLHYVTSKYPYSASMMLYRDVLEPMLAAGDTFIDPSRLAADPEWSRVYPQLPYLTLRLAGMACFYFEAPYCISTIKDEHAGFYKRIFRSEQIGEPRKYPGLNSHRSALSGDGRGDQGALVHALPFLQIDVDGTAHAVCSDRRGRTRSTDDPADCQIYARTRLTVYPVRSDRSMGRARGPSTANSSK